MPRLSVDRVVSADQRGAALEVWADARTSLLRAPTRERRERVAAKIATCPVALVATYGDRPAGMAVAEPYLDAGVPDPTTGHLSMLFVSPAWWGNHIGSALVRALQEPPEGTAWTALSVWTRVANSRARRLYVARGFVETGEVSALHEGEEILRLRWERPVS